MSTAVQPIVLRGGTMGVAIAATISWVCCVVLITYVLVIVFRALLARRQNSRRAHRLRFLRTQFGVLFANLLVSDLLQSTGFGLNWYWIATGIKPSDLANEHACTAQGLLVQAGDLGSAFWSLAIAIHTSAFIIWRYKPSALVVGLTVAFIWIVVILMCAIGPIHVRVLRAQGHEAGPFYDNAGLWCWMSTEYDPWRLWAHYLFVFISAFGSLVAYFAVFAFLYFRLFQRGVYNHHLFNLRRAADGKLVPTSNSPQPAQAAKVAIARRRTMDTEASNRGRKVDRAALIMLLFPATYICSIMPLAVFRLGRMTHRHWAANPAVQAGCGTVFALGGFWNAILYGFTRKIFSGNNQPSKSISFSDSMAIDPSQNPQEPGGPDMTEGGNAAGRSSDSRRPSLFPIFLKHGSANDARSSTSKVSLANGHRPSFSGSESSAGGPRRGSANSANAYTGVLGARRSSSNPSFGAVGADSGRRATFANARPGLPRRTSNLSNAVKFNDGLSFEDSSEDEENFSNGNPEAQPSVAPAGQSDNVSFQQSFPRRPSHQDGAERVERIDEQPTPIGTEENEIDPLSVPYATAVDQIESATVSWR